MIPFMAPMMMGAARALQIETVQSLPAMTGSNTPAGHSVTMSGGGSQFGSAVGAFDQSTGEGGFQSNVTYTRVLPQAFLFGAYGILPRPGYPTQSPYNWVLAFSTDGGSTFTTVDTVSKFMFPDNSKQRFVLTNPATANAVRLICSGTRPDTDANYIIISELELYKAS